MPDDPDPAPTRAECKHFVLAERDRCLDVVERHRSLAYVLPPNALIDSMKSQIEAITP